MVLRGISVRRATAQDERPTVFINLDAPGSGSLSLFNTANQLRVLGCKFAGRNTSTSPTDESFSSLSFGSALPTGSVVTAIATERATGNSSEFSACFVVP
jgi:hypothetical protein